MEKLTIQADGMEWPLETFIDAYGFTRLSSVHLEPDHPLLGREELLHAITIGGALIKDTPARHLPWGDVLAIKARDGGGVGICDCCGELGDVSETGNGAWCSFCLNYGEEIEDMCISPIAVEAKEGS